MGLRLISNGLLPLSHTIYLGDCLRVLGTMPDGWVDVIVTSPPYNIGARYNTYGDDLRPESYLEWMGQVSRVLKRILSDDGSLFLNVGFTATKPWISLDVAQVFRDDGWVLQNRIGWVKSISVADRTHGHLKPVNSSRFLNQTHEDIFHFTKSGSVVLDRLAIGVPYADKSNIARFNTSDLRCRGNSWFVPYETITKRATQRGGHPATFPVELARNCIALHGVRDGLLVLDPFIGTGTTMIAADQLGVTCIGVEIDPQYALFAMERAAAQRAASVLVDTSGELDPQADAA